MAGRIVPVADVFDALVHDRPHRPAWSLPDAVAKIAELSGTQFDPLVVDAFLALDHEALLVPVEPAVVPIDSAPAATWGAATAASPAAEPPSHEPVAAATQTVGPAEAAAALGVSAGTIRRWADAGRIPCVRTPGGHRRFAVSEVRAAIGTGPAGERPAVSRVTPPSHPLPAVADVLIAEGPDLARLTSRALYDGLPGWWTTTPALDLAVPWIQSLAGCLLSGTYGPAISATRRLMDRADLAGTSRLERHRFLERFSDILIRRLARDQTLTSTEILSLRRLFAALRQTLLEDPPLMPRL
jgi:excisionase family DNA binding protein